MYKLDFYILVTSEEKEELNYFKVYLFLFPKIFMRLLGIKYGLSCDPSFLSQSSTENWNMKQKKTVNKLKYYFASRFKLTEWQEKCINSNWIHTEEHTGNEISPNENDDSWSKCIMNWYSWEIFMQKWRCQESVHAETHANWNQNFWQEK